MPWRAESDFKGGAIVNCRRIENHQVCKIPRLQDPLSLISKQAAGRDVIFPTASSFTSGVDVSWTVIAIGGVLVVLSPLLLVLIFQKYLISGLVGGAVKG